MNIGIDVDGTMTDISGFMLSRGAAFFQCPASDPAAFDVDGMFSCTNEERKRFWKKNLLRYCTGMPILPGAAETIKKLHDDGHHIYIVTSRVFTTRRGPAGILFRGMLRNWLKRRSVVFDDIIFCEDSGEAKLEQCQRLGIDVMIDDKPDNLMVISEKIPVIAHPMPWNRGLADENDKNIVRAKDWADIYDIISGMQ